MAAAASSSPGALPAVMAPFGRNAGFRSRKRLDRRVGTIGFVLIELRRPLFTSDLHRCDLSLEMSRRLGAREALLRAQSPLILGFARNLVFLHQVLGMPA